MMSSWKTAAVSIRFVTQEEARGLGLRKIPPVERDHLRLIEMHDFDLTACGGTHVSATGRSDASCFGKQKRRGRDGEWSSFAANALWPRLDVITQFWRSLAVCFRVTSGIFRNRCGSCRRNRELRANQREQLLEELADLYASRLLAETPESGGRKIIIRTFPDRDLTFIKLLAQRLTRQSAAVVTLLGSTSDPPALVFAQSPGQPFDMGALMKEALARLGGRGGGSKDMAQGGPAPIDRIGSSPCRARGAAARAPRNVASYVSTVWFSLLQMLIATSPLPLDSRGGCPRVKRRATFSSADLFGRPTMFGQPYSANHGTAPHPH